MLKDLTLQKFAEAVASDDAVPGGGSVSALAASLAASLSAMVARLTLKKEKFANVAHQMEALESVARELQANLMDAVDRDADSYRQVLSAFRLPKSTEDEKQARSQAIQRAFKHAAQVPLEVAGLALQVMDLAERAVQQGNPDMITDAAVGLLMARSAALGALMNVRINLSSIKDKTLTDEIQASIDLLKNEVLEKEQACLAKLQL
ncbi:MAG: cyclodeaminase/cyclohydrolase family protein [Desulfosarcinaceae bacterium]